ncbi:MAG TPA: glycosyltransferase [Solirubrobacteraceae bacterium]|nr:glycosyltransferase [Solirubrobacteraceae bacterium]
MTVEISYCVCNTEGRSMLLRSIAALGAERELVQFETEVLVLDNGSDDGSADAVRALGGDIQLIEIAERRSKAVNDSELMERSQGRYCLLLNEDSELLPGASVALRAALEADPRAACAVAVLRRPDGPVQPSAWRFPGVRTALAQALFLHRWLVVQSKGSTVRRVDWGQSAALLVRRQAAEEVGWMDSAFFVYSDEVDFQKRLADAGWHALYVPQAVAVHHEQLSTDVVPERRIVELARGRDRYMRKHHGLVAAFAVRGLIAWSYLVRMLAALVLPGHDWRRYRRDVTATLWPSRGEGLREAAAARNERAQRPG